MSADAEAKRNERGALIPRYGPLGSYLIVDEKFDRDGDLKLTVRDDRSEFFLWFERTAIEALRDRLSAALNAPAATPEGTDA